MKITIGGIQGSGKTEYAKHLAKQFKKVFVLTSNFDWENENVYLRRTSNTREELDKFCDAIKRLFESEEFDSVDLVIFDDADLLFTSNYDIPKSLKDLHINHRHYKLALMFITRRPQDIPTPIVESSHYNFVFKVEGDNIKKKYNNIDHRIWFLMEQLKYKDYRCVVKPLGEQPLIQEKINIK